MFFFSPSPAEAAEDMKQIPATKVIEIRLNLAPAKLFYSRLEITA
jgi:hypothetical protein